jgi:hypothetical protein
LQVKIAVLPVARLQNSFQVGHDIGPKEKEIINDFEKEQFRHMKLSEEKVSAAEEIQIGINITPFFPA